MSTPSHFLIEFFLEENIWTWIEAVNFLRERQHKRLNYYIFYDDTLHCTIHWFITQVHQLLHVFFSCNYFFSAVKGQFHPCFYWLFFNTLFYLLYQLLFLYFCTDPINKLLTSSYILHIFHIPLYTLLFLWFILNLIINPQFFHCHHFISILHTSSLACVFVTRLSFKTRVVLVTLLISCSCDSFIKKLTQLKTQKTPFVLPII